MTSFLAFFYQKRIETEYTNRVVSTAKVINSILDPQIIDRYLLTLEKDEEYYQILERLRKIQKDTGVTFIVVSKIMDNYQIFAFDSDEDEEGQFDLGEIYFFTEKDYNTPVLQQFLDGGYVDPYINLTEWGWLKKAAEPIFREDGSIAAYATVSIYIDEILHERFLAYALMGVTVILISFISVAVNLSVIQKFVIIPVKILLRGVSAYRPGVVLPENSLKLKPFIKTGDEFEILERSMISAQVRIESTIADLRKAEEQTLLMENLNRTKSEFYGNISHHMKTPLTIIATDIQLAEQFTNEGNIEGAKELMREAWQETMQMANLVTEAIILARGQEVSKPMECFDFGAVIKTTLAVFEPLMKKQDNVLKSDIENLPPIRGNADMLAGALVNLLSNANEYTKGGIINVQWAEDPGTDDKKYILTVRDNGCGITPEILSSVFERGVTGGSGTGLGLGIVKSVMELHGGEVTIASEIGKGTVVNMVFRMGGYYPFEGS